MTTVSTPRKIATTATAGAALAKGTHTPVDATAGALTMTLPTTAAAGVEVSVEKVDASTNAVTVTGTLRGVASQSIPLGTQYEARTFLSEGSGSWRPIADHRTAASLTATFARVTPARLAPGAMWGFLGDSITYGTGATNSFGFALHALQNVGSGIARLDSLNAGKPGDVASGALARTDAMIAAGAQAAVVMIGTNDASTTSLASYKTSATGILDKLKAAGLPAVVCTVPPRPTSVAVATRNMVDAYNDWLRQVAHRYGFEVADTYTALADPTTGGMLAANDSGDAIHPSNLGHARMGIEVAKAMLRLAARPTKRGFVRAVSPTNLVADPLVAGGTTTPAGWFEWPGGTGTAPTYSLVADTSGVLAAGRWGQMDFDGTAAGGTRRLSTPNINAAGNITTGDRLLIAAQLQIEDVTGTWVTDVAAGTAGVQVNVINSGTGVGVRTAFTRLVGVPQDANPNIYDVTLLQPYDATADTPLALWFSLTLPTGKRAKMRYGCIGLINLTTRGSASEFGWASTMVYLP